MWRMPQIVVILAIQRQNNIYIAISPRKASLSKAAVLVRPARCKSLPRSSVAEALQSEHPTRLEELQNGERIGKCFAMFTSIHEASVWKIIFPDCLSGICHYTRCDWLQYLSGHIKPSCEVV